jgi:4-diphosphocytidyl-2-C-methyl-D-erythritol kinase
VSDFFQQSAWPAPAKLNLFLHVTGRRADGYHELQTLFQFLDFCDELYFDVRTDGQVRRLSDLAGVPEETDLVVRAAKRLQAAAGAALGVDIRINKRLPMGGGVGGGSADAATTLVALNQLWGLNLPIETLAELGLSLGADVPIFIHGRAAWAEGVGECFSAVEIEEPWYLVVQPGVHVSTGEIFSAPELTRNTPPIRMPDFLAGLGRNDCAPVVRARYPEIAKALDWLAARGDSRLTGTGACVYAQCPDQPAAEARLAELPSAWTGFVAKGCNRSPLLDRLAAERAK